MIFWFVPGGNEIIYHLENQLQKVKQPYIYMTSANGFVLIESLVQEMELAAGSLDGKIAVNGWFFLKASDCAFYRQIGRVACRSRKIGEQRCKVRFGI